MAGSAPTASSAAASKSSLDSFFRARAWSEQVIPKILYFAALSKTGFFRTIAALEAVHELGPFIRDSEDDWLYAYTTLPGGATLNMTRVSKTSTISTWMPTAPRNVNWQVILSHESGLQEAQVSAVKRILEKRLGTELVLYHQD